MSIPAPRRKTPAPVPPAGQPNPGQSKRTADAFCLDDYLDCGGPLFLALLQRGLSIQGLYDHLHGQPEPLPVSAWAFRQGIRRLKHRATQPPNPSQDPQIAARAAESAQFVRGMQAGDEARLKAQADAFRPVLEAHLVKTQARDAAKEAAHQAKQDARNTRQQGRESRRAA